MNFEPIDYMQILVRIAVALEKIAKNTSKDADKEKKPTVEGFKPGGNL